MRQEHNKLVRDLIPEIIEQNGDKSVIHVLDDEKFKKELLKKLVEESNEVLEAEADIVELKKEIGDVLEVLDCIIESFQLSRDEIEKIKTDRKEKRGGFDKKIFLEHTE
jgi:predicted house-cleaning noncanonical NTP pyrophosphatase (MazG superfamily)